MRNYRVVALSGAIIAALACHLGYKIIKWRSSFHSRLDRLRKAWLRACERISRDKRWVPERSCVILSGGLVRSGYPMPAGAMSKANSTHAVPRTIPAYQPYIYYHSFEGS